MSAGCGWEGRAFGAHYPDATCIDGVLWDMDSIDDDGMLHGGDRPCPHCCPHEVADNAALSGNARQRRVQRRALARKVKARAIAEAARWNVKLGGSRHA